LARIQTSSVGIEPRKTNERPNGQIGAQSRNGVLPGAAGLSGGWRGDTFEAGKAASGVAYGGGRPDVRIAMDGDGELYILSKSDGMIRKLTAVMNLAR
jgi:hypothetical protein